MGIYEEIVDLLGLETTDPRGDSLEDLESKLLDKLEELNDRLRSLNNEIDKVQDEIEELRDDVVYHNKMAVKSVRKEDENLARQHLRKKKDKMDKIEGRESQLSDLRRNKKRISENKSEIEDKLADIRKIRGS